MGKPRLAVRARRLELAAAALADPARQDLLVEIAERLGFSDAAHFTRAFRARFGILPGDYRAALRDRP